MPVKILLADKSITIQKVVEMLFSGRDYEVVCASDGETALNEATRVIPDVVLADVDLPRIDGYALSARLKLVPQLAKIPVILMMSRDDVFDGVKGKQVGILDNIAKPFESQELIGKVKKAIAATPPRRLAEPAVPAIRTIEPAEPALSPPKPAPRAEMPTHVTPADFLDIISEAPSRAEIKKVAPPVIEESIFEVEAVVEEVEEPLTSETAKALPMGAKAVEEMRAGLGLGEPVIEVTEEVQPEIITFETLDKALEAGDMAEFSVSPEPAPALKAPPAAPAPQLPMPTEKQLNTMAVEIFTKMSREFIERTPAAQPPMIAEKELRRIAEEAISKKANEVFEKIPLPQPPMLSASEVWGIAEETVAKMAKDVFANMPPVQPTQLSDEKMRSMVMEAVSKIVQENGSAFARPALPTEDIRSLAEETISKIALDVVKDMTPPIPKISDDTIRRGIENAVGHVIREMAKDIIERVAWEVIPQLAEVLIKEEIERLKAET